MTGQNSISKYKLQEKLGEGGFGVVYKALDTILEREVAIKVLKAEFSNSDEMLARFRKEAKLTAALKHPGIVRIIDVGEDGGRHYIVMDYMPGGSLAGKMEGKPHSLQETAEWLKPIAEALDYAHAKGLIHRDVKPSNILFTEEGQAVLSDFGLVKSLEQEKQSTTGMALGTVEYMAPEQILGKELDGRVDQYALGIVAYELLAGDVPFKGKTPYEVTDQHVHKDPPSLDESSRNISDILNRSLAKSPEERYEKCSEFLSAIEELAVSVDENRYEEELSAARVNLESNNFEEAENHINNCLIIKKTDEVIELQKTARARRKIYQKYVEKKETLEKLAEEIKHLEEKEDWIRQEKRNEANTLGLTLEDTKLRLSEVSSMIQVESDPDVDFVVEKAIRRRKYVIFQILQIVLYFGLLVSFVLVIFFGPNLLILSGAFLVGIFVIWLISKRYSEEFEHK